MSRTLQLGLLVVLGLAPATAVAQQGEETDQNAAKTGTVYTFYGLLKREQDPNISDEQKLKDWQDFIERANQQIGYAKKAVDRWKNEAKVRLVDGAAKVDGDGAVPPREKIEKWREVQKLYAKSPEGARATKRIGFWTQEETKRLVEAAEETERQRSTKVERIQAWLKLLEWTDKGPEAKGAEKRITELQGQIYAEALSVDKIARVDVKTKLDAWRDVLGGRPTAAQGEQARARIAALESEIAGRN
jgi:hypothetical protein